MRFHLLAEAFEDSLRKIDELMKAMRAERDRIRAEFELCLELFPFGQSDHFVHVRVDYTRFFPRKRQ